MFSQSLSQCFCPPTYYIRFQENCDKAYYLQIPSATAWSSVMLCTFWIKRQTVHLNEQRCFCSCGKDSLLCSPWQLGLTLFSVATLACRPFSQCEVFLTLVSLVSPRTNPKSNSEVEDAEITCIDDVKEGQLIRGYVKFIKPSGVFFA